MTVALSFKFSNFRFRSDGDMQRHIAAMETKVLEGGISPGTAADVLLEKFINRTAE